MSAPLFMGIDGGGSRLRIAIVSEDLAPLHWHVCGSANPSLIGREAAQALIRQAIAAALREAHLAQGSIGAAAIGIAGAAQAHSSDWLLETARTALPQSLLAPSSDMEIALVGAHGGRRGMLLLAGTGSAVYGIAADGSDLQIGGWGYLLGDPGSGYWIGMRLLRHIAAQADRGAPIDERSLCRKCLDQLGLSHPRDLIAWLYRKEDKPVASVAGLAKLAMQAADAGDETARRPSFPTRLMPWRGRPKSCGRRLDSPDAPVAFAGGLLDHDNPLSISLARMLGMNGRPIAKHSPVIGGGHPGDTSLAKPRQAMTLKTEADNPQSHRLDKLSTGEILAVINAEDAKVAPGCASGPATAGDGCRADRAKAARQVASCFTLARAPAAGWASWTLLNARQPSARRPI